MNDANDMPVPLPLIVAISAVVVMLMGLTGCVQTSSGRGENRSAVAATDRVEFVDDRQIQRDLVERTADLFASGKTAPMATLRGQLDRPRHPLRLERPAARWMSPQQIYASRRRGVLLVSTIKKADEENHFHGSTSAGFVLTRDGVMVINYYSIFPPLIAWDGAARLYHQLV